MKYVKRNLNIILILITCTFLHSCVPAPKNNISKSNRNSEDSTQTPVEDPTYENSSNFFEYSSTKYSGNFSVNYNFSDSFYFKGSSVNSYLKADATRVICTIFHFPTLASGSTNLVVAGLPRNDINFTTNTREYYYSLNFKTSDEDQNKSFCDNSEVNTYIANNLGGTNVYRLDNLCTTCASASYSSSNFTVLQIDATKVSSLNLSTLGLKVNYSNSSTTTGSCSADSQCTTSGLDCCINGQCVYDGTLIKTYSAAEPEYSDYLSALLDVSTNANNKKNYPQFYYICGNNPTTPPTDTTDTGLTSEEKAELLRLKLKYLYECTNPIEGEMSVCTTKYENALSSEGPFFSGKDDLDFSSIYSGTLPFTGTVTEVYYQNELLYNKGVHSSPAGITISGTNDNFYDQMTINLLKANDSDNNFKDLDIRFRTDGSCTKLNSTLAKCYKEYIQGENLSKVTDHWPANNKFKIPTYADLTRDILVSVDGSNKTVISSADAATTTYKNDINTWYLSSTFPYEAIFSYSNLAVQLNQKVRISFYVNLNNYNVLQSKQEALTTISTICSCPNLDCGLKPVYNSNDVIINYECKYPDPVVVAPPLQQESIISTKNTAHRHFDTTGVAKSNLTITDIYNKPELEQEGAKFTYTGNNLIQPNNISTYIGFNEINGSYTYSQGSALPAKELTVKKGTTYDITSSGGTFSSCYNCGSDYYSSLLKLFPDNFLLGAGGYKPNLTSSSKLSPASESIRADDLLYGRACFVPVTMLPWTHKDKSDIQTQRLNRLKTQHFLFANGYNRDWYGFDYGSLIGSFDGVKWFSIGSKRRIKATSNKLFIAINSYFADLNTDSSYTVLVQDSIINGAISFPTTDYETDGAQCQQVHACATDSDCASTLGWEYACENIGSIKSRYPSFDDNANEVYNPTSLELNLLTLSGPSSGAAKRCVYRGKGSACSANYSTVSATSSYARVDSAKINGCSSNTYCQIINSGTPPSVFNDRISRYGKSVKIRNSLVEDDNDLLTSFGLQTPLIGRSETFKGTKAIDNTVLTNLTGNDVQGICLPGKNTQNILSYQSTSTLAPGNQGDVVGNMGKTKAVSATTGMANYLYSMCPTLDLNGEYVQYTYPTTATTNTDINRYAQTQNLSTRLLDTFFNNGLISESLTANFESKKIDTISLNQNSCLRAPGSSCFSDFDCAPSKHIANKVKSLTESDVSGVMNLYELFFWQEELVCSQAAKTTDSAFDVRNNRCCRESNKKITIPTVNTINAVETARTGVSATLNNTAIPGVGINIDSSQRYSRNATAHVLTANTNVNEETTQSLRVARTDACATVGCSNVSTTVEQYKTLEFVATRTCCSENWVREFQNSSGLPSGHDWKPEKFQKPSVANFKCLNYTDLTKTNCNDPSNPTLCTSREIPSNEALILTNWFSNFELTGIPNVVIQDPAFGVTDDYNCEDTTSNTVVPGFVAGAYSAEYTDGTNQYLKANDSTNFDSTMKQIFSADTFACCMPAGTTMASTDDEQMCCTGYINPATNKCALRNYNDVSIYLNRYVSSEAQNLPESNFDTKTGYITEATVAAQVACEKRICASGYMAFGVAHGEYNLNNVADDAQVKTINRFIENTTTDNDTGLYDLFDAGLKWNNHIYCIPQEVSTNLLTAGYTVFNCN